MPREQNPAVPPAAAVLHAPVVGGIGVANVAAIQRGGNRNRFDTQFTADYLCVPYFKSNLIWLFRVNYGRLSSTF